MPDEVREAEKNAGGGKKRKEREGEGVAEDEEGEGEGEELEGGEKVDVEVEGEDSELPTVSDAKEPVVVEEKIIEPKKKKRKNKVVREIEELEQDEDWQRQVASQMAAEVEAEQRAQEEAIAAESKPAEPTPAVVVSTSVPTTPAAASTPVLNDVSREEAAAMFRVRPFRSLCGGLRTNTLRCRSCSPPRKSNLWRLGTWNFQSSSTTRAILVRSFLPLAFLQTH